MPAGGAMPNCPRREPHFSPPICHISPPTDPICVIFYINSLHSNKEYHCNKNGAKQSSSWLGTPFWPISLRENQQKGCQKGWKTKFHQIRFSAYRTIPIIKEVLLSCFEVKRGPGYSVVAQYVNTQCQNLNWISAQTTGVVH